MRPLLTASLAFWVWLAPAVVQADLERLGHEVVPTAQSLQFVLDPRKPSYSGTVQISLEVKAATAAFELHARDLVIKRLALKGQAGNLVVSYDTPRQERLRVRAARPIPPGRYTLDIVFENRFDTRATGLYRMKAGGDWYSYTQLEPDDARAAFPCWDEPEFKILWRLTLVVPAAHTAVANAPVEKEASVRGQKTIVFRETRPLPSHLVAFATGPFETVAIPGLSVPGRVVTVQGQQALAGEAAKITPPLLTALERYFGRPYPYEKLDLIAVPEFTAGAMENPGAITFADRILLVDPKAASVEQRCELAAVTAHELSHMWFGNLVTLKWWDDLWLNESFASWLGDKTTDAVYPEFHLPLIELSDRAYAMESDARLSTRAIRQPIGSDIKLNQVFDELAYQKGQALLGMVEHWIGDEAFRRGVIAYLDAHRWSNAEAADLWSALSQATGRDVGAILASFLDQPGVPLVSAEILADGQLRLRQQRFLTYGVKSASPMLWKVPVLLKFSDGQETYEQGVLLETAEQTFTFNPAIKPMWLHPNANERGYYRWSGPPDLLARLVEYAPRQLNPRERVGLIGNLAALLDAGNVHGDEFLRTLTPFAKDPQPEVIAALMGDLGKAKLAFVTPELEKAFASYVRNTLAPALERIGFSKRNDEEPAVTALRPELVEWLGDEGHDAATAERAKEMLKSHLADPRAIDPSMIEAVLHLAALHGDATLYDELRTRFETANSPAGRARFLGALGFFREPFLIERTLRYAIEGPLRPQELQTILGGLRRDARFHDRLYAWMEQNYAAIAAKIPPAYRVFLPHFAGGCSRQRLNAARRFFAQPEHSPQGAPRELAKVGDQVLDCAGLREREGAAVARSLAENGAS